MSFTSHFRSLGIQVVCLSALAAVAGCSHHQEKGVTNAAEAQAAIQDAFKQANPGFKSVADEAAAAIQSDPGKALLQLQALSSNPDLDSQQRNAAQNSILMLAEKLRAAAAQGDANAEQAMQAYRSAR